MLSAKPDWSKERARWPHADRSQFVKAGGLRWHVQQFGKDEEGEAKPKALMLHGTGASTHSWRDLVEPLAETFDVLATDLPGHGFTESPAASGLALPAMAKAVATLLQELDHAPDLIVAHSAGAAIALMLAAKHFASPKLIISFNGALLPFKGVTQSIFSPLAKLLALNPIIPAIASWRASDERGVRRLIEKTGSSIDADGIRLYTRLFSQSGHVSATLSMMAGWDLRTLHTIWHEVGAHVRLVVTDDDNAVPAGDADIVARHLANARVVRLSSGGHLFHEGDPSAATKLIFEAWNDLPG
ncbi:MAG: alpha/beta fold hydrolase BchO [Pseudomonadota bacterium]